MGMVYGKLGLLFQDVMDGLNRPDNQVFLIVAVSVMMAADWYYFARLAGDDGSISITD